MRALFDTNVLIDYLNGIEKARNEINLYDTKLISSITWMEVLIGEPDTEQEQIIRRFLDQFKLVSIDEAVAEQAIILRREYNIKLPDAIIWASAKVNDAILVSRNSKDFPQQDPGVRVPYQL